MLVFLLAWYAVASNCVPNAHALSQDEEIRISREFRREARKNLQFVEDPEVELFVDGIGRRILKAIDNPTYQYRFFVIRDDSLNAFAIPGGSIFIHTGLIEKVETSDELASVMAHEVVHVDARHIARMSGPDPTSLLGMLGVFLGPAAVIGQAISVAKQLEFSRRLEEEADNIGVRYLARAGYDPEASIGFMNKMYRETILNPIDAPPYLLTHPLTEQRINNLTATIRSRQLRVPKFKKDDGIKRVQLLLRLKRDTAAVMQKLEQNYRAQPEEPEAAHLLGIAYGATGDWARARDQLEQAVQLGPVIPGIHRDLGRAYTQTSQFEKAHAAFGNAIRDDEDDPVTHLYVGELLEKESDYRGAIRSYLRARQLAPLWPEAARRLGYAYRKLNRAGEAHYYLGQSYLLHDEEGKAIESLERAVREYKEGSPRIQVIKDEIEAIKALMSNG